MIVSFTRYHARLATCRACEHFKPSTQSCGTLIVGDTITHNGEQVELCGCNMPAKAWLAFKNCPIDKWKQKDRIFKIIKETKQFSNPPTDAEIKRFFELKSELTGKKVMPECEACSQREIADFKKNLQKYLEDE